MIQRHTAARARVAAALLILLAACHGDGGVPTAPGMRPVDAFGNATLMVTTTADDGPGSLREAVQGAVGANTIRFDPALAGQTIKLASPLTIADQTLVIEAPEEGGVTLDGDGVTQILVVQATGDLTLRNLTLTGSRSGIGAISTAGTVRVEHGTITGNRSLATSSGNGFGGGISHFGGDLTLVNTTVSGNVAEQDGGGIASLANGNSIVLIHSTVTGNSALGSGGGIALGGDDLDFTLQNSIVAGNTAPENPNCDVAGQDPAHLGVNLVGEAGCTNDRPDDIVAADPVLGPLADNGGPTRTHALLPGSPAIETAVLACATVTVDQRYVARPQGDVCDIGAFEFEGFVTPPLAMDGGGTVSKTGTAFVTGTITCQAPATLTVRVTARQQQKLRKVNTVVEATGEAAVTCGGVTPWAVALAPATGGFRNGNLTASARTVDGPVYLREAEATRTVKLAWARK